MPPSGVAPANGLAFPSPATTATDRRNTAVDYGRYVRRFTSAQECGFNYCSDLSYRSVPGRDHGDGDDDGDGDGDGDTLIMVALLATMVIAIVVEVEMAGWGCKCPYVIMVVTGLHRVTGC